MKQPLILAYDIGTSGVKASLFTPSGLQAASALEPYETVIPGPGRAEQNPEDWWSRVVKATRRMLEMCPRPQDVAVIGVCGHMLGCVCVDREGNALRPAMIHMDGRAIKEFSLIEREIGGDALYKMSGNILDPRSTLCKIKWIQANEPEIYKKTAKFLQCKDFVTARLIGDTDTTDASDAAHGEMMDVRTRRYDPALYGALGLDADKLPRVRASMDIAGTLSEATAAQLGLPSGIPVIAGGGDGVCANTGAGVVNSGDTYISLGTTAWIATCAAAPLIDPQKRVFNIPSLNGAGADVFGTTQSACSALNWMMDALGETDPAAFDRQAALAPAGSGGMVFLPYLDGERSPVFDTQAQGVFFGLSHTQSRACFMRATLEGVALALRSILDALRETYDIRAMRIIGGGAKSPLWRQIIADATDCEILLTTLPASDTTSLGIASAAALAAGLTEGLGAMTAGAEVSRRAVPDAEGRGALESAYRKYRALYPALRELMHE